MKNINILIQFLTGQVRGYRQNRSTSRRFKAYYLDTKKDNRGVGAKIIDYFLIRILIFFTIFAVIFIEFKDIVAASITAFILLSVFHLLSIEVRNRKMDKNKVKKRRYIASQKVYSEIMNKTQDELKDYMVELLKKLDFKDLDCEILQNKTLLYKAKYKVEDIIISFYPYKSDLDVEVKDLREMIQSLVRNEIKKGIIITTSEFTQDCYSLIEQLTGKYKLMLINKEMLLKLIEKNDMFPNEEEIDELIENRISKRERRFKEYSDIVLSPNKIKGYIIIAIYLLIASFYVPFKNYYIFVALITLFMGLMSILLTSIRRKAEQSDPLNIDHLFKNF